MIELLHEALLTLVGRVVVRKEKGKRGDGKFAIGGDIDSKIYF